MRSLLAALPGCRCVSQESPAISGLWDHQQKFPVATVVLWRTTLCSVPATRLSSSGCLFRNADIEASSPVPQHSCGKGPPSSSPEFWSDFCSRQNLSTPWWIFFSLMHLSRDLNKILVWHLLGLVLQIREFSDKPINSYLLCPCSSSQWGTHDVYSGLGYIKTLFQMENKIKVGMGTFSLSPSSLTRRKFWRNSMLHYHSKEIWQNPWKSD